MEEHIRGGAMILAKQNTVYIEKKDLVHLSVEMDCEIAANAIFSPPGGTLFMYV